MTRRPVDGPGDDRGMDRGWPGDRSPARRAITTDRRGTGEGAQGHARSIPGADARRAASLSRFGRSIPILHSPYGDDYPMNLLTTETTMGSR